ncbi:MAG: ABC transporter permease [Myxococcota bacterium]
MNSDILFRNTQIPLSGEAHINSLTAALSFFRIDMKILFSYKVALVMHAASIFFIVPMFYFMGRLVSDAHPAALARFNNDYFGFLLLGSGLLDIFTITSYTQSEKLRSTQVMGTLEAIIMTRLSVTKMVLFSSLFPVVYSLARFLLKLFIAVFIFGMKVDSANWFAAILILLACLITYAGIGIFLSAFVLVFKRGEPVSYALNYFTLLLGGVYFPVEYLPDWLRPIGWLIPATHAIEGARSAILSGASLSEMGGVFLGLGAVALVMFPLGTLTLNRAFAYARRRGTLSDY